MRFTDTKPTQAGYYWRREGGHDSIIYLSVRFGRLAYMTRPVADMHGCKFAGPLVAPVSAVGPKEVPAALDMLLVARALREARHYSLRQGGPVPGMIDAALAALAEPELDPDVCIWCKKPCDLGQTCYVPELKSNALHNQGPFCNAECATKWANRIGAHDATP